MTAPAKDLPKITNMKTYTIRHEDWLDEVVEEFLDAPTTRQAIEQIGHGVAEIIHYLKTEGRLGDPKAGWSQFIEERIKDIDKELEGRDVPESIQKASGQMKEFWRAVDKVIELYCCQLLMTDEEVELAVEEPELMELYPCANHECYYGAFIEIIETLHAWMESYMKDRTSVDIDPEESN